MTHVRIHFFKMSDHPLVDIEENSPQRVSRTSVPGYVDVTDYVVGVNKKSTRGMTKEEFHQMWSKQPKNQFMSIDVLKSDCPPELLDPATPVSIILVEL